MATKTEVKTELYLKDLKERVHTLVECVDWHTEDVLWLKRRMEDMCVFIRDAPQAGIDIDKWHDALKHEHIRVQRTLSELKNDMNAMIGEMIQRTNDAMGTEERNPTSSPP